MQARKIHIRPSSKIMKQITNQNRKQSGKDSISHKEHLSKLIKVWEELPAQEKVSYEHMASFQGRTARQRKENPSKSCMRPVKKCEIFINEVPYRQFLQTESLNCSLFIGNLQAANDVSVLRRHGIYAILVLGQPQPLKYPSVSGGYLHVDFGTSFRNNVQSVIRFIENRIQHGNVLVQCHNANNLACAAVLAFLIKQLDVSYDRALLTLKEVNPLCQIDKSINARLMFLENKYTY